MKSISLLKMGILGRLREYRSEIHITQAVTSALLKIFHSSYGQIVPCVRRLSRKGLMIFCEKLGIKSMYLLTRIQSQKNLTNDFWQDCLKEIKYDFEQLIKYTAKIYNCVSNYYKYGNKKQKMK